MKSQNALHGKYQVAFVVLCGLLAGAACTSRQAGRSASPPEPQGSPEIAAPREPSPKDTAEAKPPEQREEKKGFQQVVLLSQPAPKQSPPGLIYVHLERASAKQVGQLLGRLYVPSGASGAEDRYTLIFSSAVAAQAAVNWASVFDVSAMEEMPAEAAEEGDPFVYAVGILHTTDAADPGEREQLGRVIDLLEKALGDAEAAAPKRWAAGMIGGTILAERLFDYERAEEFLRSAQALASPGSLEQMVAQYTRAQARIAGGDVETARGLLANVIAHFDRFRHTEVFERSRRGLSELEKQ